MSSIEDELGDVDSSQLSTQIRSKIADADKKEKDKEKAKKKEEEAKKKEEEKKKNEKQSTVPQLKVAAKRKASAAVKESPPKKGKKELTSSIDETESDVEFDASEVE